MRHGATKLQMANEAPEPLKGSLFIEVTNAEGLLKDGLFRFCGGFDGLNLRSEDGLANGLQVTPPSAEVGELGKGLPSETLLHPAWKPTARWQATLFDQMLCPVTLP